MCGISPTAEIDLYPDH